MIYNRQAYRTCPVGVVLQRTPGVTRWQAYSWKATALLPGAGPAEWNELRREGDVIEVHAGTVTMELHGADAEAYLHELQAAEPCLYIVMRDGEGDYPLDLVLATASPYEAQDYADSGEEIVEKVAMPAALRALVEDFVETHYEEEAFVKRKRDKKRIDARQDGLGDARVATLGDVYASPTLIKGRLQ